MKTLEENVALRDAIVKLCEDHPDNRYVGDDTVCYYFKGTCTNGTCGCLIGQALTITGGLSLEDGEPYVRGTSDPMSASVLLNDLLYTQSLADWASDIQMEQDAGETWGDALKHNTPPQFGV